MQTRKMESAKHVALVAHDNRKSELVEWSVANKESLARHTLYATGTTGALIEEALQQPVIKFMSGPLGGDQQVGSKIAEGKLDVLIFFWDPMQAQPHDPDVKALLRLAVVWNIPVASSRATADFLFTSPMMDMAFDYALPDYTAYVSRTI